VPAKLTDMEEQGISSDSPHLYESTSQPPPVLGIHLFSVQPFPCNEHGVISSKRLLASQAKPDEFIAGTDGCDIWEVDRDPRVLVEGHEEDIWHVATHPTDPAEFATACGSGQVGQSSTAPAQQALTGGISTAHAATELLLLLTHGNVDSHPEMLIHQHPLGAVYLDLCSGLLKQSLLEKFTHMPAGAHLVLSQEGRRAVCSTGVPHRGHRLLE
jgi:hypothetical protein